MSKNAYVGVAPTYTPVEYIESSGTQYIDLGIVPTSTIKFEIDYQFLSVYGSYNQMQFGCGEGANTKRFLVAMTPNGNFSTAIGININVTSADTNRHTFILDAYNKMGYVDNNSVAINYTSLDTTYNIALFCRLNASGTDFIHSGRLYSAKIYYSDVLTHNYIPVLVDTTYALYDTIDGVFYYNNGTGAFTGGNATGQPVQLPSVAKQVKKMYVGINGVARKVVKGYVGIPASYTPVEYIESSGTQYIDTGVVTNPNFKIEFDANIVSGDSNTWFPVYGTRTDTSTSTKRDWCCLYIQSSSHYLSPNYVTFDPGTSGNTIINFNQRYLLTQDNGNFYVDGVLKSSISTSLTLSTGTQPMYLFTNNSQGTTQARGQDVKLYGCKIYSGGSLVREYIPVVDDNNVACLFDKVENKFYYNQGTGTFTAGSATGQPVTLPSVARLFWDNSYTLVNYIEGTGTQYINTNVIWKDNTAMEISFKFNTTSDSSYYVFGMYPSTGSNRANCRYIKGTSKLEISTSISDWTEIMTVTLSDYVIKYNDGASKKIYVNGTDTGKVCKTFADANTVTMNLFQRNTPEANQYACMRLYYCKIYDRTTNELFRDFIPVLDENNVPCLYDKVSQEYYYNIGTGTFLYG